MPELNKSAWNLRECVRLKFIVLVDLDGRQRKDIAAAAKIRPSALSSILAGDRSFSIEMVCRLADALGVPPAEMFLPVGASDLKRWKNLSRRV